MHQTATATDTPTVSMENGIKPQPQVYKQWDRFLNARRANEYLSFAIPYIKPNFNILDVGSGPGSISCDLANLVPEGSVLGIDMDSSFVEQSREAAQALNIKNATFEHGDALGYMKKLPSQSFDIINACQVLLHMEHRVDALKEMRRLLKPAGLLAMRDWAAVMYVPSIPELNKQLDWVREVMRSRGSAPEGGKEHHIWAHEAGFEWEKMKMGVVSWHTSGPDQLQTYDYACGGYVTSQAIKLGLTTEEGVEEAKKIREKWRTSSEARAIGIDSTLLCWM